MTIIDLKKTGAIYLENINEGFNQYTSEIVKLDSGEAFESLKEKKVYADFYYFKLTDEERSRVNEALSDEEKSYLEKIRPKENPEENLIFLLDDKLLKILTRLNEKEILFSTFYITGAKENQSTWWGNYNREYVIFSYGGYDKDNKR